MTPDERREALARALCDWWNDADRPSPDDPCDSCCQEAAAVAPLMEEWIEDAAYCRCVWCCQSTPPENRGESHKRLCHPKVGKDSISG